MDPGTRDFQVGRSVGEMVGGFLCFVGGLTGNVFGGAATVTGIGATVGVPAVVVSVGLVMGGAANIEAGYRGLVQALKSPNSGSSGPQGTGPGKGGENAFTSRGRAAHREFAENVKAKPGWQSEPRLVDPATGKTVIPDAVTPTGHPIELKPNTPTGRASGQRQLPKYERATNKKGRVIYYDP